MELPERLKKIVEERKIPVFKLAKMAGVSYKTIYNWYHGADPRIETVKQVCQALNITLEDCFTDENRIKIDERENVLIMNFRKLSETEKNDVIQLTEIFQKYR